MLVIFYLCKGTSWNKLPVILARDFNGLPHQLFRNTQAVVAVVNAHMSDDKGVVRGGLKIQLANLVVLRSQDKETVGLTLVAQAFYLMVSAAQLHKVVLNKF